MASRRFSQAISEGAGISVLVHAHETEQARTAEEQGAEAVAVDFALPGLREATALPVLWWGSATLHEARDAGADACVLVAARDGDEPGRLEQLQADALGLGLDCVVEVRSEEELETVLEQVDPEILLLSRRGSDDEAALEPVLELLSGVPAGKLAIAAVAVTTREQVSELERAGVDGVVVVSELLGELADAGPPGA